MGTRLDDPYDGDYNALAEALRQSNAKVADLESRLIGPLKSYLKTAILVGVFALSVTGLILGITKHNHDENALDEKEKAGEPCYLLAPRPMSNPWDDYYAYRMVRSRHDFWWQKRTEISFYAFELEAGANTLKKYHARMCDPTKGEPTKPARFGDSDSNF